MTLCIAWNHSGTLHFASDSRLTFPNGNVADVAVKITAIPVQVRLPSSDEDDSNRIIYTHHFGMCFSGSAVTAYILKESMSDVLQNLQVIPGYTDFSMEGFCEHIKDFFAAISKSICEQIFEYGEIEFIIAGYCPHAQIPRAFLFRLDKSSFPLKAEYREVLKAHEDMEFLGSGTEDARKLHPKVYRNPFKILRSVILNERVPSVGGNVQFGKFIDDEFKIFGVVQYSVGESGLAIAHHNLRGIELYKGDFSTNFEKFHPSLSFISPFEEDRYHIMQNYFSKNEQ